MASPPLAPVTDVRLPQGHLVLEHLARSEFLDVFSLWSHERGCPTVAKTLRPDRREHHEARKRLLQEGRHLLSLAHPHLVRAYELHELARDPGHGNSASDQSDIVLMLETLPGETLGHLIGRRGRRLPTGDLVELGRQLCSVVGYLHHHDLLHLDLKPSNIVVEAGRLRLLDLSHARKPGNCKSGHGTREYMPPEQLHGGKVTAASDVHGIGGVLYRATTRRRPFAHDRTHDQVEIDPTPLRRRSLPTQFRQLILDCLDPEAANRPTLAETTTALDQLDGT